MAETAATPGAPDTAPRDVPGTASSAASGPGPRASGAAAGPRAEPGGPATGSGDGTPERLARALGWFSIGLGVAELVAPSRLAKLIGIADNPERRLVLRALGLRELASGAGILARRRPTGGLWSRVGGDAMDLGLLGRALELPDASRGRVAAATVAVAGVTALDVFCSERMSRGTSRGIRVRRAATVNRPPEEVYAFWRDLENLPRFMRHLEAVRVTGDRRSRWVARGPAGTSIEWDAEITEDEPNARIAWRALEGATVPNAGSVTFRPAPGGRGTEILVDLAYDPPGGSAGAAVAALSGEEPSRQIAEDLRRLKQLLEAGEIATGKGPAARTRPSLFGR